MHLGRPLVLQGQPGVRLRGPGVLRPAQEIVALALGRLARILKAHIRPGIGAVGGAQGHVAAAVGEVVQPVMPRQAHPAVHMPMRPLLFDGVPFHIPCVPLQVLNGRQGGAGGCLRSPQHAKNSVLTGLLAQVGPHRGGIVDHVGEHLQRPLHPVQSVLENAAPLGRLGIIGRAAEGTGLLGQAPVVPDEEIGPGVFRRGALVQPAQVKGDFLLYPVGVLGSRAVDPVSIPRLFALGMDGPSGHAVPVHHPAVHLHLVGGQGKAGSLHQGQHRLGSDGQIHLIAGFLQLFSLRAQRTGGVIGGKGHLDRALLLPPHRVQMQLPVCIPGNGGAVHRLAGLIGRLAALGQGPARQHLSGGIADILQAQGDERPLRRLDIGLFPVHELGLPVPVVYHAALIAKYRPGVFKHPGPVVGGGHDDPQLGQSRRGGHGPVGNQPPFHLKAHVVFALGNLLGHIADGLPLIGAGQLPPLPVPEDIHDAGKYRI